MERYDNKDDISKMEKYLFELTNSVQKINLNLVNKVVKKVSNAKTIYLMGNGGSAATANHFACDLVNSCNLNAVSLVSNVSIITATANDLDYTHIFSRFLERKLKPNDVVIVFSCSGKSLNIIEAASCAKYFKVPVIAFTGNQKTLLREIANIAICVEGSTIELIEDIHLILCHLIARKLKHG